VTPIRVLLAGLPALHDVLDQARDAADDIELVDTTSEPSRILLATGQTKPDVVVIEMEGDELPGIATHLLAEYPDLKVLGVTHDIRRALLYEFRARLVPLGPLSPRGLVVAIREAMRAEAAD
jgi:DNA-binding NarL/FixJ family response regulator